MRRQLLPALRMLLVLTVLTGLLYPLAMTGIGQTVVGKQADGSLITDADGKVVGSSLIGQAFDGDQWFHGRPSSAGDGYDAALIDLLRARQVPATLFLNRRWIVANPALAAELAADPLFELESHGVRHVPLSVTGSAAYGIAGTASVGEAYDEVVAANDWFAATLGRTPWFFRSGTAHYDEVAVAISRSVGQAVAGFSVNADAGATYTATQVAGELARVRPGDIVISHMNRPGRGTSGGYAAALPTLLDRGVRFVRLRDGF